MKLTTKNAAKKVDAWWVNGVHLPPYGPSLDAFADALAEEMWECFIAKLEEMEPLGKAGEEQIKHKNFIGSVDKYKRIFMIANKK